MNEKYENLSLADDIFDHSEFEAERLQERADERREEMAEDRFKAECARDVMNAVEFWKAMTKVLERIQK